MSKSWNRLEVWLGIALIGGGLIISLVFGVWTYVRATTKALYPSVQAVPSTALSTPSAKWGDAVEQGRGIVRTALAEKNYPGLSVAVGVKGDIVWAEGFGFADLDKKESVAPDTRFRIGTASIALTSAAVGVLLEKSALKLDDEIQTYVPEFPKEEAGPVTLRGLMGHTAGIRNDGGDEGPLFTMHCAKPGDAVREIADGSLRFPPGTQYRFSSYGWILMSAAVEAAAKQPFLDFMRKQVFEPLGMNDTVPDDTTSEELPPNVPVSRIERRATSYFPRFAADNHYGQDLMRPLEYSCYSGASVFLSTPSDLVRFAQGMNSGALLKPETVRLFQTSQKLPSGEPTGYGLGWDLETADVAGRKEAWIGHEGMVLGGMAGSLIVFPERGVVIALLSNTSYADTESLGLRIAQAFTGVK